MPVVFISGLHVLLAAQAYALANDLEFVIPEDVRATLPVVMPHRLVLPAEALIENLDTPYRAAARNRLRTCTNRCSLTHVLK